MKKLKVCPWCKQARLPKDFFDAKTKQSKKVCKSCLYKRRKRASKASYAKYLRSAAWQAKKAAYRASGRSMDCFVCGKLDGTYRRDFHHLTYARLGKEKLDDIVPICHTPCHRDVTLTWREAQSKKSKITLKQVTLGLRAERFRGKMRVKDRKF